MRSAVLILACAIATACSSGNLDDDLRRRAIAALDGSFGAPLTIDEQASWAGSTLPGLVCGRIAASPVQAGTRQSLRFFYDDRTRQPFVEQHELIVTFSSRSQALLNHNRELFDRMWQNACADEEPWSSWLRS